MSHSSTYEVGHLKDAVEKKQRFFPQECVYFTTALWCFLFFVNSILGYIFRNLLFPSHVSTFLKGNYFEFWFKALAESILRPMHGFSIWLWSGRMLLTRIWFRIVLENSSVVSPLRILVSNTNDTSRQIVYLFSTKMISSFCILRYSFLQVPL